MARQRSNTKGKVPAKAQPAKAKTTSKATAKSTGKTAKGTGRTTKAARAGTTSTRTVRKSMSVAKVAGMTEPTTDEIRKRAYEIYMARGCALGDPVADWLQAERELRESKVTKTTTRKR
jgi:hypothetical protein